MTREGPPMEVHGQFGELEVELPEIPTSGYLWSLERVPAGVEEVGRQFLAEGPAPVAGGAGLRLFRLRVPAPGRYQLEFVLKRPWEARDLERRSVILVVGEKPRPAGSAVESNRE
jgi:predicted secreted protein